MPVGLRVRSAPGAVSAARALNEDEDQAWQDWAEPAPGQPPGWEDLDWACDEDEPDPSENDFWRDRRAPREEDRQPC